MQQYKCICINLPITTDLCSELGQGQHCCHNDIEGSSELLFRSFLLLHLLLLSSFCLLTVVSIHPLVHDCHLLF